MKIKTIFLLAMLMIFGFTNSFATESKVIPKKAVKTIMSEAKVSVEVTDVFNDSVLNQHFSYGKYELPKSVAERFVKSGKAKYLDKKSKSADSSATGSAADTENTNDKSIEPGAETQAGVNTGEGEKQTEGEIVENQKDTPLPDDFPYKSELEAQGIASIEKVQALGNEGLLKLENIGQAKVTKIGLYLAEVEATK